MKCVILGIENYPALKRKIYSSVLICSLLLPFLGIMGWLKLEELKAKRAAKSMIFNGLEESEITSFVISSSNEHLFDWEGDDEFEFQEDNYDVIKIDTLHDGSLQIKCWKDDAESEVKIAIKTFKYALFQKSPDHKNKSEHLISFLKHLYCSAFHFNINWNVGYENDNILLSQSTLMGFSSEIIDPPKFVVV